MCEVDQHLTSITGLYDYSDWAELVVDNISNRFYIDNSGWVDDEDGLINKWLFKLSHCDPRLCCKSN